MRLCDLNVGSSGVISYIENCDIKRRFLEIGIVPGNMVSCVFKSPFNDPKAFLINGTIISIRNEESKFILLEVV